MLHRTFFEIVYVDICKCCTGDSIFDSSKIVYVNVTLKFLCLNHIHQLDSIFDSSQIVYVNVTLEFSNCLNTGDSMFDFSQIVYVNVTIEFVYLIPLTLFICK